MRTSDLLTRFAGFFLLITSLWNIGVAALWVITYMWLLFGFLWVIPLVLALCNLVLAIVLVAFGHNRFSLAGPLLGLFIGLCNFNFLAMFFDLMALGLMLGSYAANATEGVQDS